MEITKTLPFDFCDTCPDFSLDTACESLLYGDIVLHSISISCEHKHVCERIKKNLESKSQKGGESET